MTRLRSRLTLAVALGAALGCTSAASNPAGVRLRQPTSIAVFQGRTLANPTTGGQVHPYLAVANAARNDVSIVDAENNQPILSPIKLRTLELPTADRPTLLASASLGDDGGTIESRKPDLLVAVSGGDSVLQVIDTWDGTDREPVKAEAPLGFDFGAGREILALAPVPSLRGTARIAVLLADARVAVVSYQRVDGDPNGAITRVADPVPRATPLPFRPLAIAAMPDDGDLSNGIQTALYLATLDPIEPGVYGVAELSADDVDATPRALGARGPTRLVAAMRLRERNVDPNDPDRRFVANDPSAFAGQPVVKRVYAVLDESGCGPTKPIDCGVVTLDPGPDVTPPPPSNPMAIPPDWAGLMPYRAPMRIPGRPLAIAVSGPPVLPPPDPPSGQTPWTGYMRIFLAGVQRATTGVAAVPSDGGGVYFLDLGRFETAANAPITDVRSTGAPTANNVSPDPSNTRLSKDRRLWLQTPDDVVKTDKNGNPTTTVPKGTFVNNLDFFEMYASVKTTPGFTTDETWRITYQGFLSRDLFDREGEVGREGATGPLWLALQSGDRSGATPTFTQVAKLWHPDLGVQPNDIVVVKAAGVPAPPAGSMTPENEPVPPCVGKKPLAAPGTTVTEEFELRVGALLPPSADHPGGAVALVRPAAADAEWRACYDALAANATPTNVVSPLLASIRAHDLVMVGDILGYAGRPELGSTPDENVPGSGPKPFALAYPTTTNEDQLAAACPLADWDGSYPADPAVLTCGGTCDRTVCEQLVLARKARRFHNVSVDCATDPTLQASCETQTTDTLPARWPPSQYEFPFVNGPSIAFAVAVQYRGSQPDPPATNAPVRDMSLTLAPASGVNPLAARQSGTAPYQASDAISFDRTPWANDGSVGYRFFVSYPADFVLDTSPSQLGSPVPSGVIR